MGHTIKTDAIDHETLILETENQYLTYWITNLELDYISFLEVCRDHEDRKLLIQDSTLEKLIKYLEGMISDTDKLLNPSLRSTAQKRVALKKYRSEVQNRVKVLTAYSDFVVICEYLINRKESQFDSTYQEIESDEDFAGAVLQFLFEDEDSMIINDKIKQVYAQLPIRMSKNRYFNYTDDVLNRLKGISRSDLDQYVDTLKELFYPEDVEGFGEVMPLLYERVVKLKDIDSENLDSTKYRELVESYEAIAAEIEETMNFYIIIVSIINELLGFLSVLNEQSYMGSEKTIKHFKKYIDALSQKKAGEALIDETVNALLVETEGIIEKLILTLGKQEVMVENILESDYEALKAEQLIDRYETIGWLSSLTSGSFFAVIDKVDVEDLVPVDAQYLGQSQRRLTNYLEPILSRESKAFQRARMALSFTGLHIIHTKPQEVYDFILESLIACKDKGEKTISRRLIRQLMAEMR